MFKKLPKRNKMVTIYKRIFNSSTGNWEDVQVYTEEDIKFAINYGAEIALKEKFKNSEELKWYNNKFIKNFKINEIWK